MTRPLTILGCGYVGTRLAKAALAADRPVKVAGRSTGKLAPMQELGATVKYLDAGIVKQIAPICSGTSGGTVVFSIPPVTLLPPGQRFERAMARQSTQSMATVTRDVSFQSSGATT